VAQSSFWRTALRGDQGIRSILSRLREVARRARLRGSRFRLDIHEIIGRIKSRGVTSLGAGESRATLWPGANATGVLSLSRCPVFIARDLSGFGFSSPAQF
jgi:hypothetical protein